MPTVSSPVRIALVCAAAVMAQSAAFSANTVTWTKGDYSSYENVEANYLAMCSWNPYNSAITDGGTVGSYGSSPGFGAMNQWRIGNNEADSVEAGTGAIGIIGLLYATNRLNGNSNYMPSGSSYQTAVKSALGDFFWSWVRNSSNQINSTVSGHANTGFYTNYSYGANGQPASGYPNTPSAAVTAEILMAMWKYCNLSPNGDITGSGGYEAQAYSQAKAMGYYIANNLSTCTSDRSYAYCAYENLSQWATAEGDSATASTFSGYATNVQNALWGANDDNSPIRDFYDYMSGSTGYFDNGDIDQVGFAPYEMGAIPASWEAADGYSKGFGVEVASWWQTGTFDGDYLTVQSGPYTGGVCQSTPSLHPQAYPGDTFQFIDAAWKAESAQGWPNITPGTLWNDYFFGASPYGSSGNLGGDGDKGSTCWNTGTSYDGYQGGFIDWINTGTGAQPSATYERFCDTSAYFIVATEELAFSNQVNWNSTK